MPRIVQLKPENAESEDLPPTFYVKFSLEEFPSFLANPSGVMTELGYPVENFTVSVKDHIWDSRNSEWVTDNPDKFFADNGGLVALADAGAPDSGAPDSGLPAVQHWTWVCGVQDEMCICERVLGG